MPQKLPLKLTIQNLIHSHGFRPFIDAIADVLAEQSGSYHHSFPVQQLTWNQRFTAFKLFVASERKNEFGDVDSYLDIAPPPVEVENEVEKPAPLGLVNKINAIKALRTWTLEQFGHACGLKQAKDMIEDILVQVEKKKQEEQFLQTKIDGIRNTLRSVDSAGDRYKIFEALKKDFPTECFNNYN